MTTPKTSKLSTRQSASISVSNFSSSSHGTSEEGHNFSVGDRVWVNGTKPGVIQYLGPTRFAAGEWAGIVLDQPLGKNNGTVDGIQYFQCDPLYGLFSKTSKLAREPLNPFNNGAKTSSQQLQLGKKVSLQTSTGPKIGLLRYLGPTEFAAGEWAGIELDEPKGKNDGSVGGKKYFTCNPYHGLFAPSHKVTPTNASESAVSLPPSNQHKPRKPFARSNSIISSIGSGRKVKTSAVRINRSNSSLVNSLASNKLNEVLQEEQQQPVRDNSQTDQAEKQNVMLRHKLKELMEGKRHLEYNLREALATSEQERESLLHQIEEHENHLKDLHYRLEEESNSKVDLSDVKLAEIQEQIIKKYELLLHMETLVDQHQKDYICTRAELDDLKVQRMKVLEELKSEKHFLETEIKLLSQELEEEHQTVESLQNEQNILQITQQELCEELIQLALVTQERDVLQTRVSDLQSNQQIFKNQIANLHHQNSILHSNEKELAAICDNQKIALNKNAQIVSKLEERVAEQKEVVLQYPQILEERRTLEKRVMELQHALTESHMAENSITDHHTLQSQIDFLNSVIVDMPQKNDRLNSQIEFMENSVEDSTGSSNTPFRIPPRIFCDFCERFDSHDTNDF
ncbi:CLIP1 [Cordylochernes scorpioides]|uniref:CLIP1 n=1 Tax=Cordylochernes scorpioides TaxID=51811 RepID=A0ABY6KN42_9ARAC|nr:CLIP1 [Cordylochernes scorpioides]